MQFLLAKLPVLAIAAVLLLFCGAGYLQLMPLYEHYQNPNAGLDLNPKAVANVSANKPQRNIPSYKLFGDPTVVKAKPVKEVKNLPKTTLKLVLRGVSAGEDNGLNGALIEGPDKKTDFYKVGDSLPGNAELDSIYSDRIVLSRNGRLENLYFPAVSKGGGPLFTSNDDPEDVSNGVVAGPKPVTSRNPTVTTPQAVNPRTKSIKERLSSIRERIRSGQY